LTATRLGQVLERASVRFESKELLEDARPHRRREAAMHFGDILERAPLIIANQDRAEVPDGWSVASECRRQRKAYIVTQKWSIDAPGGWAISLDFYLVLVRAPVGTA
jgi:hypothetical protein